jgi:hypothetical protein
MTRAAAPVLRADTRRLVLDAAREGCRVRVAPDGTIDITPPAAPAESVAERGDLIDWRKHR